MIQDYKSITTHDDYELHINAYHTYLHCDDNKDEILFRWDDWWVDQTYLDEVETEEKEISSYSKPYNRPYRDGIKHTLQMRYMHGV